MEQFSLMLLLVELIRLFFAGNMINAIYNIELEETAQFT